MSELDLRDAAVPDGSDYFTLVFKGDIRKFDGNPFHVDTPFGRPVAAGMGDAFAHFADLEEEFERLAKRYDD